MMQKKRWIAAALAGAMALTLTACGSSEESTTDDTQSTADTSSTESTGGEAKKVSVILKTLSAEYWQYCKAGAEAYGQEHGITVDVKGPSSETAFEEQISMIETDLNADYDAYIIAPLQPDTVTNLVQGESRPIVALDSDIPDTGNEAAAKLGGAAAVEAAKAAGWTDIKAIEICGVQGEPTNEARKAGYMAGIEENGGDFLEEETQYADATADRAVNCMEAIMQTHPEGVAIVCANNDDMAMAAARTAAGNEAYANTIFLGFNGDKSACESILNGELSMSVAQNAYDMAYKAVETACQAVAGQDVDEFVDSGAEVITSENAQTRLDTLSSYLG